MRNNDGERRDDGQGRDGPDMVAYSVRQYGEDQSSWSRIGAAFEHKDGKGMDIVLNAVPVDGRVTLREQQREEFKERQSEKSRTRRAGRARDEGREH